MSIAQLIEISNFYGKNPDFVLAGGGNTSYKTDELLYIKGSGTTLATISADGFVKMNRPMLHGMWQAEYSSDEKLREEQVLADLMAARMPGEEQKRPSVETSLHELFEQTFVVHTHPALINGITCAKDGEAWAKKLFGDDIIWIPPAKPGYLLAAMVREKLTDYKSTHQKPANVVFLANHGIFIAADTTDEIKNITDGIVNIITPYIKRQPDLTLLQKADISMSHGIIATLECNAELERYITSPQVFAPIASVFSPDHMVYYGIPAFAETMEDIDTTRKAVVVKDVGLVAMEHTQKSVQTVIELFNDTLKIAAYAENFGGGMFMPDWLIAFIADWEVESYRKKLNG